MTEPTTPVLSFPEPSSARFDLRCWGEFRLLDRLHGADCSLHRRKARAVIAYLASNAGAAINRERLATLLWSERGDEQARASLRQALVELRPYAKDATRLLLIDHDQVQLNALALTSDVARLETLARSDDLDALSRALADKGDRLYSGLDGLDPAFDEWLALERRRRQDHLLSLGAAAGRAGCNTVLTRRFPGSPPRSRRSKRRTRRSRRSA
jgi:DNA-binding SARP family transcriptional activator